MKKITKLLLLTLALTMLTACGQKKEEEEVSLGTIIEDTQDISDVKPENLESTTKEEMGDATVDETDIETTEDGKLFESDNEVTVVIDGVEVKLLTERSKLEKIVNDNNWELVLEKNRIERIITPSGTIIVSVYDRGAGEEVLMSLKFLNTEFDLNNVKVKNMTGKTIKVLQEKPDVIMKDYSFKYYLSDNVFITADIEDDKSIKNFSVAIKY